MDWPKVRSLFDRLAGLGTGQRAQRLEMLSDPRIANEIRDLLASYDQGETNFLVTKSDITRDVSQSPRKRDVTFAFHPGNVLAQRFLIVRPIGRGGMGEVYEADDINSGRRVAVKCIRTSMRNDNTVRLFRQEIDVARQITDPHVCRVHDVFVHSEEGMDILLLSMELIEGETLQQRIQRSGAMPAAQAETLVRQLLSGLAAAQRAGIVHSDLKPGNILIAPGTGSGSERLVITDFGLARKQKSLDHPTTAGEGIAGTFEYMSPEQLRGETLPASDVYSVGLIIFEMVTGRRPFHGTPVEQALQRLLEKAPRARKFAPRVPLFWEHIIGRCLERDASKRFQTAEQVTRALDGDFQEYGVKGLLWWSRRRWRSVLVTAGMSAVVLAAATITFVQFRDNTPRGVSLRPATTGGGLTMQSAISNDGAWLAYVSDRETQSNLQLWIQKTEDEANRRRVTDDQFDTSYPSFSDDGKHIIFRWERGGGGLYVADVAGGVPRLLVHEGVAGRFSPDGRSVAYWTGEQAENPTIPGEIYLVASNGGESRRLVPNFASARNPVFLADGVHLLFEGARESNRSYDKSADWYVLNVISGAVSPTGALAGLRRNALHPYNQPGNFFGDGLIFSARSESAANVYQYRFDTGTFRVRGEPEQLTFATALMDSPSISRKGMLAVSDVSGLLNVWRLAASVAETDTKLTDSMHYDSHPSVSSDNRMLAFGRTLGRERQIWVKTPSGERSLVTTPQEKYWPVIRPDGAEIAFAAAEQDAHSIFTVRTRDAFVTKICTGCGDPTGWSHDGRSLLITEGTPTRIALLDVKTGAVRELASGPSDLGEARFGPEDRAVAFRENLGSHSSRIVIASADPESRSPRIPVTEGTAANDKPQWSEDGKGIYYLSNQDGFSCIYFQALSPGRLLPLGRPSAVRHFHSHSFTPAEVSRMSFNFSVVRNHIIANPATVRGNVWTGWLSSQR